MSDDLPVLRDTAIMPQTFDEMMKQADVLVKSGLLPQEVKTPAAAVAIMLTGRELAIPPMQAFRSIYVVKGKPTLSAQLMAALIRRAGHVYTVLESTNERCVIEFRRRDGGTYQHEFTAADAKRAGLGGAQWQSYPKAMLFSRCMSAGARVAMPDVLAGMYTPEEIAEPGTVVFDEHGSVVAVKPESKPEPKPEPKPERPKAQGWNAWPEKGQRLFWARARDLGLSNEIVHRGAGVESMSEYAGTMDDALTILQALDYAVNKTSVGMDGLTEALGGPLAQAVAEGATVDQITTLIEGYIEEQVAEGADIQRQQEMPI
jgi:hypothetical protein